MNDQRGRELNVLIGNSDFTWSKDFQVHGKLSPWHQVLSQLIAIIGDTVDDVKFLDARVQNSSDIEAMGLQLILFTSDLVIDTNLEDGSPVTRVVSRRSIEDLRILEVPIVSMNAWGVDDHTRLELKYPGMDLALPYSGGKSDELSNLLPGLVSDIAAGR